MDLEGEEGKGVFGEVKASEVQARQARQAAYRARQSEVASLLGELWELRHGRERPGAPCPPPSWADLAAMVRALIHEEKRIASAVSPARPATEGPATGLSTVHISPLEQSSEKNRSNTGKKGGSGRRHGKQVKR